MSGVEDWEKLGAVSPDELVEARLEAHWAAQVPAAVGNTLVEPRADFSHLSFAWNDELRAFLTPEVEGKRPFRAGLRPIDLSLLLTDAEEKILSEHPLVGKTLDEGIAWLSLAITTHTGREPKQLVRPDHELPEHPTGAGEPFSLREPAGYEELARWFANADRVLEEVRRSNEGATAVVTWPHHFDAATLIQLDPGLQGEEARTIGVGMSPGDGSYSEPYYYVTPWPYPEKRPLPDLAGGGRWHVEGWTGAVLNGTRLSGALDQAEQASAFVRSAVREARALLDAESA